MTTVYPRGLGAATPTIRPFGLYRSLRLSSGVLWDLLLRALWARKGEGRGWYLTRSPGYLCR